MLLVSVLLLNGCEDALKKDPLDEISAGTIWASEENALMALYGAYRGNIAYSGEVYGIDDWWGYYGLVFLELASDNALDRRRAGSPFEQLINGTLITNNDFIGSYWGCSYSRINRCNNILDHIDKVPTTDSRRERMRAEARFLRATQYFYLSQYYGDVPLVETVLTAQEANNVKKTSKSDLVAWVIKELQEAAENLPRHKDIPSGEYGRASTQAALAFLGRMQLADRKYADAAATYKKIIDYNDHIIDPNYQTIFFASNEASNENIFVSTYREELAGNPMAQQAFPGKDGGWCFVCPLSGLFEAYPFITGEPFSYDHPLYDGEHLEKNRDPRLGYTLLCNHTNFFGSLYISHPDSAHITTDATKVGQQTTQTGFLLRKFFEETVTVSDLRKSYGNDFPIIRYAEILLSYLEAKLEAGDDISRSLLDETINEVRGRESVNLPPVTETDPVKLRVILRNERRIELAMEGIRYWDLLRWETAHEVLQGRLYGAPFPGAQHVNANKDPYHRWDTEIDRSFRKDQDYRWPVPQSEQNINPNLR
jgi:hypothetical protein